MPIQTTWRHITDQMPSFSTIYEDSTRLNTNVGPKDRDVGNSALDSADSSCSYRIQSPKFSSFHFHRNSTSTLDSTASSPVTVASLAESHNSADTPAISPETPQSTQSLSSPSLLSGMRGTSPPKSHTIDGATLAFKRPSPSRKPRNLKNLAVDTNNAQAFGRAMATASIPISRPQASPYLSVPDSPTFIKPQAPPARKSSNLGLKIITPASDSSTSSVPTQQGTAASSFARQPPLRHHVSTPVLPVASPVCAPEGGMRLPPIETISHRKPDFSEPTSPEQAQYPNTFELPQSLEEKADEAYPNGPACIYQPNVYLGPEPTTTIARQYDCVFNVASEVKNPFDVENAALKAQSEVEPASSSVSSTDSRSFTTPGEYPVSPDTPTLSASKPSDRPEYIHIPWEHNTDIVPDLHRLVKEIDARAQDSKKVLIHCQQGVSRSASLVVAYGLYKNPGLSVQEAYDAVKRQSRWISPNMNLIMQLQEFRTGLIRSSAGMPIPHGFAKARSHAANRQSLRASADLSNGTSSIPQTAPIVAETSDNIPEPIVTDGEIVSAGPSSAPSGLEWTMQRSKRPSDERKRRSEIGSSEDQAPKPQRHKLQPLTSTVQPKADASHDQNNSGVQPADVKEPPKRLPIRESASEVGSAKRTVSPNRKGYRPAQLRPESLAQSETKTEGVQPLGTGFGLTSPRPMKRLPPLSLESFTPGHRNRNSYSAADDTLMSPRLSTFAMAPVQLPEVDDGFGLTSPRQSVVSPEARLQELSQKAQESTTSQNGRRMVPILPPDKLLGPGFSSARGSLKSKLGMSTRSNYDLRSEYSVSARARGIKPPPLNTLPGFEAIDNEAMEALKSPRAEEITKNPFHEALLAQDEPKGARAHVRRSIGKADTQKSPTVDPRSPPQRGAEPIVQNIFDVL